MLSIRNAAHNSRTVFFQPFVPFPIFRKNTQYFCIELSRMIHFFPMAEFMDNHTVKHLCWRQHKKTVEIQVSIYAATPPPCLLISYSNSPVCHTNYGSIVRDPLRYRFFCLQSKYLDIVCSQFFIRMLRLHGADHFYRMGMYPCLVFPDKLFNLSLSCSVRYTDN